MKCSKSYVLKTFMGRKCTPIYIDKMVLLEVLVVLPLLYANSSMSGKQLICNIIQAS